MTTASKITLVRVVFIPLLMVFMYLSGGCANIWMWLALAVFILASITDYIDGHIARTRNQVTDFGKFLDPLADKLLVIAAMCMFCQWGMMPAWATMVIIAREFAISGLRMVAAASGKVIAAAWSGKIKTVISIICICVMMTPLCPTGGAVNIICIALMVIVTVVSGVEYFIKNGKVISIK